MNKTTDKEVMQWMTKNVRSYYDPVKFSVDETQLAVDCYQHFHPEWNGSEIPTVWYEYSINIALKYELELNTNCYTAKELADELEQIKNFIYTEHSD